MRTFLESSPTVKFEPGSMPFPLLYFSPATILSTHRHSQKNKHKRTIITFQFHISPHFAYSFYTYKRVSCPHAICQACLACRVWCAWWNSQMCIYFNFACLYQSKGFRGTALVLLFGMLKIAFSDTPYNSTASSILHYSASSYLCRKQLPP